MAADRTPATRPGAPVRAQRSTGSCLLIGLVTGLAVPIASWALRLGGFAYVLLPLASLAVGALVGRSVRASPRVAGGAFFVGAAVWAVLGAGGGLLWLVRVALGLLVALVAGAAFATAVAWRQNSSRGRQLQR